MQRTIKIIDQMKREVVLPVFPLRIVSLVPSQTELLYDLGLGDRVVGITKFCIHPNEWFDSKPRVGGTKNVNFEKIAELQPDLIIGNKEENLETIEEERFQVAEINFALYSDLSLGSLAFKNWERRE